MCAINITKVCVLGGEQREGTAFAAAFPGYDSAEVPNHQQRRQNGLGRGSNNKKDVVMFVEDLPDQDEPFTHRRELNKDGITFIVDDSFNCDRYLDAGLDVYGCKKGEYAACYYQTTNGKKKSTDSGEYHTTCWDYEKYGAPDLGNSVGTSIDKYWAACAPCDCAPVITSQFPAPTIKVGKQEKKLQCPVVCLPDNDGDGCPDNKVCFDDTDSNGVPDSKVCLDDANNDGVPDSKVCLDDANSDGVPDLYVPQTSGPFCIGSQQATLLLSTDLFSTLLLSTDLFSTDFKFWELKQDGDAIASVVPPGTYGLPGQTYKETFCGLDPANCYQLTLFVDDTSPGSRSNDDIFFGSYSIEFDNNKYTKPTMFFGDCTCDQDTKPATLSITTDCCPVEISWQLQLDGATKASAPFGFLNEGEYGNYFITFDGIQYDASGPFTGSSETILIGQSCPAESSESMLTGSVAVVEKPIQVHTTLVSDATHVAQLSISVPFDQHVTVDIIDAQTGAIVATLFDGIISSDSPQVVSFDLGKDISTLQYKAEIKGENEAEKITLYLFKPDYQGK